MTAKEINAVMNAFARTIDKAQLSPRYSIADAAGELLTACLKTAPAGEIQTLREALVNDTTFPAPQNLLDLIDGHLALREVAAS